MSLIFTGASARRRIRLIGAAAVSILFTGPIEAAHAQASGGHDSGDTAWILVSTALVLFMTIPALALFYGGLVRMRNVLSVLMQCLTLTALLSVAWVVIGYSLAFDTTGMEKDAVGLHAFIGGPGKAFLRGITSDALQG